MEECEMQDCDLAFEYSDVKARIKGTVESVKIRSAGIYMPDGLVKLLLMSIVLKMPDVR